MPTSTFSENALAVVLKAVGCLWFLIGLTAPSKLDVHDGARGGSPQLLSGRLVCSRGQSRRSP